MGGVWVIGEVVDGRPTRLTLELATLAARMTSDTLGGASVLLVVAGDTLAAGAAEEVAAHGAAVIVAVGGKLEQPVAVTVASVAAPLIEERAPDVVLVGATSDGKDVAGLLVGLTGLPILVAVTGLERGSDGLVVEARTFGGRVVTRSIFREGRGIILVRPGAATAQVADMRGEIEHVVVTPRWLPAVRVLSRVAEAATGASIDEARVIVGGGRGVAGPEGVTLLEALARELGGAVGATRAAVDAGWIDFAQQIGQTGKTVKPDLYIACGVSGATQHAVGIQSAGTIVAVNKDPGAPVAQFADLLVVGDLFEIVPRLTEAIRSSRDGRT